MDGSGYPEGLKGEEIPLEARIMAIADVYDALVSKRVYKDSYSFERADQIKKAIQKNSPPCPAIHDKIE
jgi:putative two-component system response regulator